VIVVDDLGETHVQGNSTNLTGGLLVMGDLTLNGGTFIASDNYAAIVVYGDLSIAGGTTVEGIVYVTGATSFGAGNNTITGSLISAGGVTTDVLGNTEIIYDEDIALNWQDLTGLVTTSVSAPEISWSEE